VSRDFEVGIKKESTASPVRAYGANLFMFYLTTHSLKDETKSLPEILKETWRLSEWDFQM